MNKETNKSQVWHWHMAFANRFRSTSTPDAVRWTLSPDQRCANPEVVVWLAQASRREWRLGGLVWWLSLRSNQIGLVPYSREPCMQANQTSMQVKPDY
jgi:hypothetical protein